jgi:uncharacterized metal-binding protein
LPEAQRDFLIIPCGGTTAIGTVMREAVLQMIAERKDVRILDLAPFLAGVDIEGGLLETIPPERRIALSGCSECCPFTAMTVRGIEVGHRLSVDGKLSAPEAKADIVRRVYEIVG